VKEVEEMPEAMFTHANQASSADINSPLSGQPVYGYFPVSLEDTPGFADFATSILAVPKSEADAEEAKRPKRTSRKR
jgi:hypothetical protein